MIFNVNMNFIFQTCGSKEGQVYSFSQQCNCFQRGRMDLQTFLHLNRKESSGGREGGRDGMEVGRKGGKEGREGWK